MRSLAEFIMRGRRQAVAMALLFTFLPGLSWVGDVIMALVTLRHGAKEGGVVLLWLLLPAVILSFHYPELWVYRVLGGSALIYGFALVLRNFASWKKTLDIGMCIGLFVIVILHMFKPDLAEFWRMQITHNLTLFSKQFELGIDATAIQQTSAALVPYATGIQIVVLLISSLSVLIFARWWQAILYNPGGLSAELYNIRLNYAALGILVILQLASFSDIAVATDCLPVIKFVFVVAALSLLHGIITITHSSKLWLLVIYSLFIVLFYYVMELLVLLAVADVMVNIRQQIQQVNK